MMSELGQESYLQGVTGDDCHSTNSLDYCSVHIKICVGCPQDSCFCMVFCKPKFLNYNSKYALESTPKLIVYLHI